MSYLLWSDSLGIFELYSFTDFLYTPSITVKHTAETGTIYSVSLIKEGINAF
jgi:hypothetical protein